LPKLHARLTCDVPQLKLSPNAGQLLSIPDRNDVTPLQVTVLVVVWAVSPGFPDVSGCPFVGQTVKSQWVASSQLPPTMRQSKFVLYLVMLSYRHRGLRLAVVPATYLMLNIPLFFVPTVVPFMAYVLFSVRALLSLGFSGG
jgi:hypothetical protein